MEQRRTATTPNGLSTEELRDWHSLIADRLLDDETLMQAIANSEDQSVQGWAWVPWTLANGDAGLVLMLEAAASRASSTGDARSAERFATAADSFLRRAAQGTQNIPLVAPGLFGGAAGLAHALRTAATREPRYTASLQQLDASIAGMVHQKNPDSHTSADQYDLISGWSGTLLYLCTIPEPKSDVTSAIKYLQDLLVDLCSPSKGGGWDPWTIRPEQYPLPNYADDFPHGYINLGLSHGIPGIALALAAAIKTGRSTTRSADALERCVTFIQQAGPTGRWGTGIPVDSQGNPQKDQDPHGHVAWCYGGPGVCVALLRAAQALRDTNLETFARESWMTSARHHLSGNTALSATLCHGQAGVVLSANLFVEEGRESAQLYNALRKQLQNYSDAPSLLGVRDQEIPGHFVDDPSLLTGASGVAYVLSEPPTPSTLRFSHQV